MLLLQDPRRFELDGEKISRAQRSAGVRSNASLKMAHVHLALARVDCSEQAAAYSALSHLHPHRLARSVAPEVESAPSKLIRGTALHPVCPHHDTCALPTALLCPRAGGRVACGLLYIFMFTPQFLLEFGGRWSSCRPVSDHPSPSRPQLSSLSALCVGWSPTH
eukprot:scaffold268077_cov32-Tisochrysis_lutea.AAC.1